MLSKDLENILESFPSFIEMIDAVDDPTGTKGVIDPPLKLATITKAIWFIIPFHFLAFFGLVPISDAQSASVVIVLSLCSLIILMWTGTILGSITGRIQSLSRVETKHSINLWVVNLFTTWFICVFIITLLNLIVWIQHFPSYWPNLVSEIDQFLISNGLINFGKAVLIFAVPVLSGVLLSLITRKFMSRLRGFLVHMICVFVSMVILATCIELLNPVTRSGFLATSQLNTSYRGTTDPQGIG